MKKEFTWDDKKKRLIETTTTSELLVGSRPLYDCNKTEILELSEVEANNQIHELERQIEELRAQQKAIDKQLDKAREKIGPVDPVFQKKFESAMIKRQINQQEEAKENSIKMCFDVESKLQQIKRAMGLIKDNSLEEKKPESSV